MTGPATEPRETARRAAAVAGERAPPAEVTEVHTRILRCTLAVDDCFAYWQRVDTTIPTSDRARVAFEQRWFGTKSEARVRTIMTDMIERFDAFPEALLVLQEAGTLPARLRPFICHLHTQLADPIYRRFTGEFLPGLRREGRTSLDRPAVARWIQSIEPDRWSASTAIKFASNLLATAFDVGLVGGKRDPRKVTFPAVPEVVLAYALYLLRDTAFEGALLDNPYLRSLGVERETFRAIAPRVPGVRFVELGGATELTFDERSLTAWAPGALGAAS